MCLWLGGITLLLIWTFLSSPSLSSSSSNDHDRHNQIITIIIIKKSRSSSSSPIINTALVTEFDSGKAPTLQHQKASALHLNARGQRLDSNYEYLWLSASDYFMLWLSASDYHLILQVEHSGVRPTYQFKCLFNKFCCFQQCLLHEIKMYVIKIKAQWSTVEHGKTTNHRNSSGTQCLTDFHFLCSTWFLLHGLSG